MGIALVVEDDRTQQIIIWKILQRIGLEVIFAGDGVEALQLVESHHPERCCIIENDEKKT